MGGSAHKPNTPGGGSVAGGGGSGEKQDDAGGKTNGAHRDGKGSDSNKGGTPTTGGQPVSNTAPGSDSGDSSPLGPILVGIAILAGGSIAYLMYRRRREAEGDSADSSPSPEAS